ncbi:MAG TPA: alpha/beta hydrolase [Burkholderiales bacterium]|nr:alpha/beta hydrolase [Burkholderiales bacterium]
MGAAGALAVLGLFLLQERMLFHPRPGPQSVPGAQSVFIQAADGTRLHAWHVQGAPGAPLVLYFGGNAEQVSWMAGQARQRAPQASWLLVDYRGYGLSEGSPSETALVADALAWYDESAKSNPSIYLFGRSLGSGVAVQLAAQRPVGGVILVAPYDSMVEVGAHHYPFLPVRWLLKHRFESLPHAARVSAPLLCLVAGRDEVIPLVHSKRLFDAWKGPKRWVELPGAGHNSTDGAPQFWGAIRSFLDKNNEKPA